VPGPDVFFIRGAPHDTAVSAITAAMPRRHDATKSEVSERNVHGFVCS
jgi:hypothetical protein